MRYCSDQRVSSRYLQSIFMGHGRAQDILEHFLHWHRRSRDEACHAGVDGQVECVLGVPQAASEQDKA